MTQSRLTKIQVKDICTAYLNGETMVSLAQRFKRTHPAILNQLRRNGVATRPRSYFRSRAIVDNRAVQQTNNDLRAGRIVKPSECSECHAVKRVVAHHDDYNKPKQIRWLCDKCHHAWHRNNDAIARADNYTPRIRRKISTT